MHCDTHRQRDTPTHLHTKYSKWDGGRDGDANAGMNEDREAKTGDGEFILMNGGSKRSGE